jgi:tetrapyrrole methylase family protein / MazG family protein
VRKANLAGSKFQELVGILAVLRGPDGCPWDKEQDERSIANYFLEEVYEAVDAISRKEATAVAEELGDVLMEVVFISRIYEEKGKFTVSDSLDAIIKKMIRRHPHVFGRKKFKTSARVLDAWIKQKKSEKKRTSYFGSILPATPALQSALQIGERVSHFGFDWPSAGEAMKKVREEIGELEEAMAAGKTCRVEEEIGDCFFALANVARLLRLNPEIALRRANEKFVKRFRMLETKFASHGRELGKATLAEMDAVWEEVKKKTGTRRKRKRN